MKSLHKVAVVLLVMVMQQTFGQNVTNESKFTQEPMGLQSESTQQTTTGTLDQNRVVQHLNVVYPNPVVDQMFLNISGYKKVTILDLNGSVIVSVSTDANQINLEQLLPGVYVVEIVQEDLLYKTKVFKEN